MQSNDSSKTGLENAMRVSDTYRQQLPRARFFTKICRLFEEEITHLEALSYLLPGEILKDTAITPSNRKSSTIRSRAFCYSIRLYAAIEDDDWERVSCLIEKYRIPLTIGSAKATFEKSNDEAKKMQELQSVKIPVEEF